MQNKPNEENDDETFANNKRDSLSSREDIDNAKLTSFVNLDSSLSTQSYRTSFNSTPTSDIWELPVMNKANDSATYHKKDETAIDSSNHEFIDGMSFIMYKYLNLDVRYIKYKLLS